MLISDSFHFNEQKDKTMTKPIIATVKEPSPSVKRALAELERVLGNGLYPSTIRVIESILSQLEQEAYEYGFEQAQYTVGDWNKP